MECKVIKDVELPTNRFFIAEIINIYSEEQFMTDGKPDEKKVNAFLLTMPDNRFWSVGECVGKAWKEGNALRERLNQAK